MNYALLKDCIQLLEDFELATSENLEFGQDISSFQRWISQQQNILNPHAQPEWEGKENGRSADSVISTQIVHMNRYAKLYSKSAILDSDFSTQDDFIFLINLKAFGEMSKTDLIKRNIQDKPTGIQIINRLIEKGFVEQKPSAIDLRSKIIALTSSGLKALEKQMDKIRTASSLVTGNLTADEKMELIRLLNKLETFHQSIYVQNVPHEKLLSVAEETRKKCQK